MHIYDLADAGLGQKPAVLARGILICTETKGLKFGAWSEASKAKQSLWIAHSLVEWWMPKLLLLPGAPG